MVLAIALTLVVLVLATWLVIWISPRRSGHGAGTADSDGGTGGFAGGGGESS